MFQYIYPQFQSKRLLRAEMLEQLRDYPRTIVELAFNDFSDGVVSGCEIRWENEELIVERGMILYKKKLYFLSEPYTLSCKAQDRMRFLKVRFTEEYQETTKIFGVGEIVLENKEADLSCELELCRFYLQEGAKLRTRYENFEDYSTRYDTVNLINTPYAAKVECTLSPALLIQYATELVDTVTSNNIDISFAMNILAQGGVVPIRYIRLYLKMRCKKEFSNMNQYKIYQELLSVLKELRQENHEIERQNKRSREILLV